MIDQTYLRTQQYQNASNLNARINLHARCSTNKQGWQRWLFEQLRLPPHCRIVELGCGPGNLWRDNLDRLPPDWQLVLTDFSAGMVEQARRNLGSGPDCLFAVADAQWIPFGSCSFDGAFANHMLYHVPERARALAEIQRVLRPGGRLYASTVGERHMRELDELVCRFDPQIAETGVGLGKPYVPFSLENGGAQLAQWFGHVTLRRYEDALEVTEAAPLVDYIRSGTDMLTGEKLDALTRFMQQELEERGVIRIAKDTGVFEAVKEG